MTLTPKNENFELFLPQRNSLFIRGLLLTAAGGLLTLLSVIHPDVRIMSQSSSWLPFVAFMILISSALTSIDAFILRHSKEFFINLHVAISDGVIGLILLTELNKSPERLILLSAAYLAIKGLFRIFAAVNMQFSQGKSATWGGFVSLLLGILLWQEWPFSSLWFICFCLSLDIMTRGWALIRFGLWLKDIYNRSDCSF